VTAEKFFKDDKKTLTDELNQKGDTALKIAVRNHANIPFLENLLNQIVVDRESLPTLANALGYAIRCGNKVAVKKLVENKKLLFYENSSTELPLLTATCYSQRDIFDYLFIACKQNIQLTQGDGYINPSEGRQLTQENSNPFEGSNAFDLFIYTIVADYIDVAYDLYKYYYPELAKVYNDIYTGGTLHYLAEKRDAYRSGKRYNFYERFVYSHVPANSCSDTGKIPVTENQETYKVNPVTWKSYVYPGLYLQKSDYIKLTFKRLCRVG